MNLTKNYRILTSKNKIRNKIAFNLLIRTAKIDELAFTGNFFIHSVYKQNDRGK